MMDKIFIYGLAICLLLAIGVGTICGVVVLLIKTSINPEDWMKLEDEDMVLEELLRMLKAGRVSNINSYYTELFIRYLEELKVTRKALEMACRKVGECDCCDLVSGYKCNRYCGTHWQEYFLKKAREEV